MIRKCKKGDGEAGKPWCLYTKDGSKLLGRHSSKEDAHKQEAVIHMHGASVAAKARVIAELIRHGRPDLANAVAYSKD